MDELGFRGTTGDTLSVSYTPAVKSPAARKAAASRSNVSLTLSQPSRLPSPRGPSVAPSMSSKSSRTNGKAASTSMSATSSSAGGKTKFKSLRNMLPFGPKQPTSTNSAATAATTSSSSSNRSLLAPPMQAGDLRHRRSSSSIPTSGMPPVPKGFLSVGRRTSMTIAKEKTLPALPPLPRSYSEDLGPRPPPVMSISRTAPTPSKINTSQAGLPLPDDPFKKPSPGAPTPNTFPPSMSRDFGSVRGRGDLSTIIETELSHLLIFKDSPPSESRKEDAKSKELCVEEVDAEEDDVSDRPILEQLAKEEKDNNNLSIMHGRDLDVTAATADLSASWEAGIADLRRSLQVPADQRSRDGRTSPSSTYSISPVSGPPSTQAQTPPTSLPVDSKSEVQLNSPEGEMDGEHPSFDLSIVDPDLAAMLSPKTNPNRLADDASARIAAVVDSVMPPPPVHSSPSPSPSPEPDEFSRRKSFDPDDAWLAGASSRRTSVSSKRRALGLQSSPVRKSRPSSLALSSDSQSLREHTRKTSIEKTPITNHQRRPLLSPTPRAEPKSPRTSTEDLTETVRRRPRVALSTADGGTVKGRARTARLYTTPSHPSTSSSVQMGRVSSDSGRSFLRGSHAREDSTPRVYSPTSRSRSTTSLGVSSRANRGTTVVDPVERPATALSAIGRGPPPVPQRSRKRSMSTTTDTRFRSRNNNVPDWMGPRTVRAFAAAGLLDVEGNQERLLREKERDRDRERDRTVVPSRAESRMRVASSRPSFDRDYRTNAMGAPPSESAGTTASSMYSFPRAGYSEHGTFPTTGRRRTSSRTMTVSELASARVESPVTSITSSSNTRTLFSASTATSTSLSCSSSHQPYQVAQFESEMATLKEKHMTEMEAVLGALADSQRTSKSLREENTQLKGRIRDLEEQLADLIDQLDEARRQAQRPRSWQRYSPKARPLLYHQRSSPRESPRASPSHPFVRTSIDSLGSDCESTEAHTTARDAGRLLSPNGAATGTSTRPQTRASMASSVFPNLPSNMSMLLHDGASDTHLSPAGGTLTPLQLNAYASSAGSPSASPTLNVNRLVSSAMTKGKGHNRHATNLSLSSIEMSMLSSLPGSPKSLNLKPEHEKHLCDLKSIDFSVIDSD